MESLDKLIARMNFRQSEGGVWVAEESGSPSHLLGLIVPEQTIPEGPTLILPLRPKIRDGMGAYATESELGLPSLTREEIAGALEHLPSELTLLNLATVLSRVSHSRTDAQAQLALAAEIFDHDAPIMGRLRSWSAEPGHVVFSEQGLFALFARAVIHCRADTTETFTPDEWLVLKRLIVASTSLLHDDPEEGDFGDEYDADHPEPFLAYMTQNLLFNATSNLGSALARTWRMFGELAWEPTRSWKTPVDLKPLLLAIGLSIEEQLALGFSLYAGIGMDSSRVVLAPATWRSACQRVAPGIDPEALIEHIAISLDDMRAELTSDQAMSFDPDLRWSAVPFIEKPFLRISGDRLLLTSPRCIEGWMTDGIHYRLLHAAAEASGRKGVQHFTAFAGELTEVSTTEMAVDSYERGRLRSLGLGEVLHARPLQNGDESTDLFVRDDSDVVVIEISSSRVTAATRLTGDLAALQRDLGRIVVKRVQQLDKSVVALRNDEFDDLADRDIERIFPVVVNVEPVRWSPMLHAYLNREAPGLLRQRGVQPLQFIDIEDFEALMSAVGPRSLASLIDQKIREAGIDADVLQWFLDSALAPRPDRPRIVAERLDRQFARMIEDLGFGTELAEQWRQAKDLGES